MERVSLKVIARELGVSTATVSLVLNGKNQNGRVSKDVSEKILAKAAELNYVPNSLAKGLKMGHSKSIGLIIADISNVFFGTLALHIQNFAEQQGYTVIIGNTNEDPEEMLKMITFLNSRQVDGLIITPTERGKFMVKALLEKEKPLVLVDRIYPDIHTASVMINNFEISYRSTRQLFHRGCNNPAFISYKQDQYHTNERKRGYLEAMREAGHNVSGKIKEVSYNKLQEDMDGVIEELLQMSPKVDAIFFATNSISIAGIRSLLKKGLLVQKDIQVMCFDESEAILLFPFRVPYVKQPIEEMAKHAFELLIGQIERKEKPDQQIVLDAELIV